MAADEADAVLSPVQAGNGGFQFSVWRALACGQTTGRGRHAVACCGLSCSRQHTGITVEAQIVITGEVQVFSAMDRRTGRTETVMTNIEDIFQTGLFCHCLLYPDLGITGQAVETQPFRCYGHAGRTALFRCGCGLTALAAAHG